MPKKIKVALIATLAVLTVIWGFILANQFYDKKPAEQGRDAVAVTVEKDMATYLKTEKPYSVLLSSLKEKQADLLAITADGEVLVRLKDASKFYVHAPAPQGLLTEALSKQGEGVQVVTLRKPSKPAASPGALAMVSSVMQVLLPLVLISFLVLMLRGMVGKSGKPYTVVKKSTVRFDDIIGVEDAKQALQDVVAYLKQPQLFADIGARAPKGVLMEGPPGTGKTLLAKAVAGECGVPFYSLNGANFSAPIVGLGIMRVKALFKDAAKHAPCVIFIDELDGLGNREGSGSGGAVETENARIINAVLTELDGFDARKGIVVIGATNFANRLDAALIREGRFDRRCQLGLPNVSERAELFAFYAKTVKAAPDVEWARLARLSAGLAPSAIAAIVNAAALNAALDKRDQVEAKDLAMALERQQMGAPTSVLAHAMTEELKLRVAVHEAGHALVGWKTGMGTLDGVTIVPRSKALGVTLLTQEKEGVLYTESELKARMATFLAGRAAEKLVLGEASTGASNDLERASHIALQMVAETGLAGKYGAFSFKALGRESEMFSKTEVLPDAVALLNAIEQETDALLLAYRPALDALTQMLLEKETLTGEEAQAVLEQAGQYAQP